MTRLNLYCILLLALAIAGCSANKAAPVAKGAAPPAPVSVAQAVSKSVTLALQAVALLEALHADSAAIDSARANMAADQAALDRAKLQLEYSTIKSPIDGRTGHLMVKQGNVIKATDQDLITINQVHPIFVTFAI